MPVQLRHEIRPSKQVKQLSLLYKAQLLCRLNLACKSAQIDRSNCKANLISIPVWAKTQNRPNFKRYSIYGNIYTPAPIRGTAYQSGPIVIV